MKSLSIRELIAFKKNSLSNLPILLTRYNLPFAVIVSVKEYEKLKKDSEELKAIRENQ